MNLTPEQINTFLADAVLKSQIGEAVEASVKRSIESLSKSWDNPFDHVIKNHVVLLLQQEISTKYAPMLNERIQKAVADHMTEEVIQKFINAGLEKIKGRY